MSTVLAILTTARTGGHLANLLRDIETPRRRIGKDDGAPWAGTRVLWCDGDPDHPMDGSWFQAWTVFQMPRQGPPNTFAFWDLLAAVPPGHDLLFLEDDIRLSPGAIHYAARIGCPPSLAYVSWFDPICKRSTRLPRIRCIPASEILPCQMRTFPAASVAKLLTFRSTSDWLPGGGSDACIAAALADQMAAVHVPSLCQHVGTESAVNPGQGLSDSRTSETWMGDAFDVDRSFASVNSAELFGGIAKGIP